MPAFRSCRDRVIAVAAAPLLAALLAAVDARAASAGRPFGAVGKGRPLAPLGTGRPFGASGLGRPLAPLGSVGSSSPAQPASGHRSKGGLFHPTSAVAIPPPSTLVVEGRTEGDTPDATPTGGSEAALDEPNGGVSVAPDRDRTPPRAPGVSGPPAGPDPGVVRLSEEASQWLETGRAAAAEASLAAMVALRPDDAGLRFRHALAALAAGYPDLSGRELARAVALDPDLLEERVDLLSLFGSRSRLENALAAARKYEAAFPLDSHARFLVGFLERHAGSVERGRDLLAALVRDDPGFPAAPTIRRALGAPLLRPVGPVAAAELER